MEEILHRPDLVHNLFLVLIDTPKNFTSIQCKQELQNKTQRLILTHLKSFGIIALVCNRTRSWVTCNRRRVWCCLAKIWHRYVDDTCMFRALHRACQMFLLTSTYEPHTYQGCKPCNSPMQTSAICNECYKWSCNQNGGDVCKSCGWPELHTSTKNYARNLFMLNEYVKELRVGQNVIKPINKEQRKALCMIQQQIFILQCALDVVYMIDDLVMTQDDCTNCDDVKMNRCLLPQTENDIRMFVFVLHLACSCTVGCKPILRAPLAESRRNMI